MSTTGHEDNIAHVTVELANPFSADLHITQISSSVTSHGINLGSINQTVTFPAGAKATSKSPSLNLDMNLDPSSIFSVTRALAVDAGLQTEQLDGIVALGGISYVRTTDEDSPNATKREVVEVGKRANIYTGFNLPEFVDAAFKELRSDISLSSVVTIGEYLYVNLNVGRLMCCSV